MSQSAILYDVSPHPRRPRADCFACSDRFGSLFFHFVVQEVSQPAIFVCSMAAVEKLRLEKGDAVLDEATCAMGLSLGEYSALCFAGAITFEDGVKVTKARSVSYSGGGDGGGVTAKCWVRTIGGYGGYHFCFVKSVLTDGTP